MTTIPIAKLDDVSGGKAAEIENAVSNSLRGDEEASAEQRQAASMFLCWPMNMIELTKKDKDLPKLIAELAKFIARREANARTASSERIRVLEAAADPETLEAIADEIDCFKHSARAAGLRSLAKAQRAALHAEPDRSGG